MKLNHMYCLLKMKISTVFKFCLTSCQGMMLPFKKYLDYDFLFKTNNKLGVTIETWSYRGPIPNMTVGENLALNHSEVVKVSSLSKKLCYSFNIANILYFVRTTRLVSWVAWWQNV